MIISNSLFIKSKKSLHKDSLVAPKIISSTYKSKKRTHCSFFLRCRHNYHNYFLKSLSSAEMHQTSFTIDAVDRVTISGLSVFVFASSFSVISFTDSIACHNTSNCILLLSLIMLALNLLYSGF